MAAHSGTVIEIAHGEDGEQWTVPDSRDGIESAAMLPDLFQGHRHRL